MLRQVKSNGIKRFAKYLRDPDLSISNIRTCIYSVVILRLLHLQKYRLENVYLQYLVLIEGEHYSDLPAAALQQLTDLACDMLLIDNHLDAELLNSEVCIGLAAGLSGASLRALGTCQGPEGLPSLAGRECFLPGLGTSLLFEGTVSQ